VISKAVLCSTKFGGMQDCSHCQRDQKLGRVAAERAEQRETVLQHKLYIQR